MLRLLHRTPRTFSPDLRAGCELCSCTTLKDIEDAAHDEHALRARLKEGQFGTAGAALLLQAKISAAWLVVTHEESS